MEDEDFLITPERIVAALKSCTKRTWRCGTPEVLAAERKLREEKVKASRQASEEVPKEE
ncbi:MAG: hypothetical protein K5856_02720 [Bacteroidaceae bacterium]|nr:hypothetical protein [Bacteroidaceae bacterium]